MKTVIKTIVVLFLVASMCFTMTGCNNDKKDIENLMLEFEYACNTLDFDSVLNCLEPKVSDNIKLTVGLIGAFTDTDTDEMFDGLSEYLLGNSDVGGSDFFSSIKIDVQEVETEEDYALVSSIISYNITGEEIQRIASFECVYYIDKWYISNIYIE